MFIPPNFSGEITIADHLLPFQRERILMKIDVFQNNVAFSNPFRERVAVCEAFIHYYLVSGMITETVDMERLIPLIGHEEEGAGWIARPGVFEPSGGVELVCHPHPASREFHTPQLTTTALAISSLAFVGWRWHYY
jgi:hypothetical protein